jgi:hypothetical protein
VGLLKVTILAILFNLAFSLLGLAVGLVIMPALIYRHVVHGKGFMDALDLSGIMRVVTTNTSMFATFSAIYLVGNMVGGLGIVACCIGAFVTMPMSAAIHGNAIRAFEQANGGL